MFQSASPPLPGIVAYAITALCMVIVLLKVRGTTDRLAQFLALAIYLRFTMSAFPGISYDQILPGLSINALGSALVVGVGVLLIRPAEFRRREYLPIWAFLGWAGVSALANLAFTGFIEVMLKWLYMVVLASAMYMVLRKHGPAKTVRLLLPSFVPLLLYQGASIALGIAKASESDGSASFIGGYNHEAAFSVSLFAFLVLVSIPFRPASTIGPAGMVLTVLGIVMANYRTTLLASVPILLEWVFARSVRTFERSKRVIALIVLGPALALGIVLLASLFTERFAELFDTVVQLPGLFKAPYEYTFVEARLLSSRPYLWASYIYAWANAPLLQNIFGFGPDSWGDSGVITYAHNTLVSHLYEFGVVGALLTIWIWARMLVVALSVTGERKTGILAAHAGFFILNMATMPHWMIEGNIAYALIIGYTIACRDRSRALARARASRAIARAPIIPAPVRGLAARVPVTGAE